MACNSYFEKSIILPAGLREVCENKWVGGTVYLYASGIFNAEASLSLGPRQERGRDSCLRAVLCYKRLFTKACIESECKRFFLKKRKMLCF